LINNFSDFFTVSSGYDSDTIKVKTGASPGGGAEMKGAHTLALAILSNRSRDMFYNNDYRFSFFFLNAKNADRDLHNHRLPGVGGGRV